MEKTTRLSDTICFPGLAQGYIHTRTYIYTCMYNCESYFPSRVALEKSLLVGSRFPLCSRSVIRTVYMRSLSYPSLSTSLLNHPVKAALPLSVYRGHVFYPLGS